MNALPGFWRQAQGPCEGPGLPRKSGRCNSQPRRFWVCLKTFRVVRVGSQSFFMQNCKMALQQSAVGALCTTSLLRKLQGSQWTKPFPTQDSTENFNSSWCELLRHWAGMLVFYTTSRGCSFGPTNLIARANPFHSLAPRLCVSVGAGVILPLPTEGDLTERPKFHSPNTQHCRPLSPKTEDAMRAKSEQCVS